MKHLNTLLMTALLMGCIDEAALTAPPPEEPVAEPEPTTMWYADTDGDGYGDANDPGTASTVQPDGYVGNTDDCDDTAENINPDGVELNSDAVDSDCDGVYSHPPFSIGDTGPAGGIVFQTDGTHGLEVDRRNYPRVIPVPWEDRDNGVQMGCWGIDIPGAESLDDGKQNSADILAADCEGGSGESYSNGTLTFDELIVIYNEASEYDDWFLPAKNQLATMYVNLYLAGNFGESVFGVALLSSTEAGDRGVYLHHFPNNFVGSTGKGGNVENNAVRFVREF